MEQQCNREEEISATVTGKIHQKTMGKVFVFGICDICSVVSAGDRFWCMREGRERER